MGAIRPGRPSDVRAVIFDFYGTLVRMVPPLPAIHEALLRRRGLDEAAGRWGDQWSVGPGDGEEHLAASADRETYLAWERGRLRRRALACGVPEDQADDLAVELDLAIKDLRLELYADSKAVLTRVREHGLTVAVCSNWFWDLDQALDGVGLGPLVDVAVTSARAGARKPHPLIYRAVLDECGIAPGQALFVGDMWEADVLGPLAQGIRAVHLWRPDRAVRGEAPPLPGRAHRITDLHDLIRLL
ncbi:HAD family hydrolase [Streptomyces katsurahamanus]|uniref:HAD family hydrolase n=1 Tax=Streptomyces katsurahamanus TaxID=2577098 RepID=A0ABW9P2X4_9ACTN|nr:HAD family hydrolase [Streptomyces katsurahamanus]MQS39942.1 HAD family hydrolase [Streptomyces katsurahamanus]